MLLPKLVATVEAKASIAETHISQPFLYSAECKSVAAAELFQCLDGQPENSDLFPNAFSTFGGKRLNTPIQVECAPQMLGTSPTNLTLRTSRANMTPQSAQG